MSRVQPFVSVVTPFYNTQAYLAECIESVLAQTYHEFEYLLVDNHSTDRSAEIAASYAARDSRIRLIRTDSFLTQVQNYNFALAQSAERSQYCKLIQADDWLFPRCLEEMVALAEAHPRVAIVGAYRMLEAVVDCTGLHPSVTALAGRDACRKRLFGEAFLFGSPSNLLYRADVVRARRPFYQADRLFEDTDAAFEILRDREFGFVHQILSFSRRQEESIMSSSRGFHIVALDSYITAKTYGREYLTSDEHEARLRALTRQYYYGLAGRWLAERVSKRDDDFWKFQERGLATIGERVDDKLLAWHVAELTLRSVLSPLEVARSARRVVSAR